MRLKFKSDAELLRYLADDFLKADKTRRRHPTVRAMLAEFGLILVELKDSVSKLEALVFRLGVFGCTVLSMVTVIGGHMPGMSTIHANVLPEQSLTQAAHFGDLTIAPMNVVPSLSNERWWSSKPTNSPTHKEASAGGAQFKTLQNSNSYPLTARNYDPRIAPGEGAGQRLPSLTGPLVAPVQYTFSQGRWQRHDLN